MKLWSLAHVLLLGLTVGACTGPPSDPRDRYAWMTTDMTREQIEKYYGFAVFAYDSLLSYSSFDNPRLKPDWPVKEGMSVGEVRKILGNPTKACAGEYYTESFAHWFCYKNDVLISKERRPSPF